MNESAIKLLEQLAQKLGTTSEYLWRVLLRQASIDATITLIQIIIIMLFGFTLYKIHRKLMKTDDSKYGRNGYSKYEEGALIPMILAALVFAVLFVRSILSISTVINGYFNPEYWALDKIINTVK